MPNGGLLSIQSQPIFSARWKTPLPLIWIGSGEAGSILLITAMYLWMMLSGLR